VKFFNLFLELLFYLLFNVRNFILPDLWEIFFHDFLYLRQGSWLTLRFLLLLAPLFNELLVLLKLGPHLLVLECQLLLSGDRLFDLLPLISLIFRLSLDRRNRSLLGGKASIIDEVEGRLVVSEDGVGNKAVLWNVPDLGRANIVIACF